VDEESACLSIGTRVGLSADHKDINKFSDRKGPYDDVIYCLQRIYEPVVELEMKTKNPNDSEYHHSKGGLIEVLADGDRNKSQMPVVEYVCSALILPVSLSFQVLSPSKAWARTIP
jgi:hypothetical protein